MDNLSYPDYESLDWQEILEHYFVNFSILEITDFDRGGEAAFLISLNDGNESLEDEALDILLSAAPAYYLEVCFALEKPLVYYSFWKYHPGHEPFLLEVSEVAFLSEQEIYQEVLSTLIEDYCLLSLSYADLKIQVADNNEQVSVYYKYFNQNFDKIELPFDVGFVK